MRAVMLPGRTCWTRLLNWGVSMTALTESVLLARKPS
jgi:hypothetical protein